MSQQKPRQKPFRSFGFLMISTIFCNQTVSTLTSLNSLAFDISKIAEKQMHCLRIYVRQTKNQISVQDSWNFLKASVLVSHGFNAKTTTEIDLIAPSIHINKPKLNKFCRRKSKCQKQRKNQVLRTRQSGILKKFLITETENPSLEI